jgi:hypothetical protein
MNNDDDMTDDQDEVQNEIQALIGELVLMAIEDKLVGELEKHYPGDQQEPDDERRG